MKENYSKRVQNIMKVAKEEAIRLGHSYVGSEHLLLGLLVEETGLSAKILDIYDCDPDEMIAMVEDMIKSSGGTMTLGHLPLTRRAERILRGAFNEATGIGSPYADDEHLLIAMLKETDGIAYHVLHTFGLDPDTVGELLSSSELDSGKEASTSEKKNSKSQTPTLDHFSRDITEMARKGKLDPVIGRKSEIERVAQILTRRKKNNPVLIGEPGVGKTAIIEGLAQRIIRKTVPRVLHNQRILSLDLASLVAGTKYRGQFEERMKNIMQEMESSDQLIVFIDELHTLVGAGGASGSLDASNMFKPALARGDIHCIGATTLDEYRKHIEKDGALDRRFQKITIIPPSIEESKEILFGLKPSYEEHHQVMYSDEAIDACVLLSDRYISDKFLPDKAIDVMDESGARMHMFNMKVPDVIIDIEKSLEKVREKKDDKVASQLFEEAALLRDQERKLIQKLSNAQKKWQENEGDNKVVITDKHIADVVSMITGIPVQKVAQSESHKLLNMSKELKKFILGQDEALSSVTRSIQRARTGLKSPTRPIGVFLFLGPTGVGKTECAKVLAKYLFPQNNALIKVDMSEYSERFSLSRLIGAPPGYVGYDEGGDLTEKVRRSPYSVVLLDEVEKAHPDLFNILLQVFDEGVLTDSFGRKIDFKNTIIIMTSNMGSREYKGSGFGFGEINKKKDYNIVKNRVMKKVLHTFSPELINRIDETVIFKPLDEKSILKIIDLQIADLVTNLASQNIQLKMTAIAKKLLVKKGYDENYGVRPLRREIQISLEDKISELLLEDKIQNGDIIKIATSSNDFTFNIVNPPKKNKTMTEKKNQIV